jgi:hypothetical protein
VLRKLRALSGNSLLIFPIAQQAGDDARKHNAVVPILNHGVAAFVFRCASL